jgi:hypothetical protein
MSTVEPQRDESARDVVWKAVTWVWAFLGLIVAVSFVFLGEVFLHRWWAFVLGGFLALTWVPRVARLLGRWRARRAAEGSL